MKNCLAKTGFMVAYLCGAVMCGYCDSCITNDTIIYQISGKHGVVVVDRIKSVGDCKINLFIPRSVMGYDVHGIGDNAFLNDLSICSVNIEQGVWRIGDNAFRGCSALERVVLPDSLLILGHQSFMGCSKLEEVRLPGMLTDGSGSRAFAGCESLSRVVIADDLSCDIVPFFYECGGVNEFVVGSNQMYRVIDGCLYDSTCRVFVRCPIKLSSSDYRVRDGVMGIAACAFFSCRSLRRVLLPDTLREIGDAAFGCSGLEEVALPDGVSYLGMESFAGCTNLHSAYLPRSVSYVGINCFTKSSGLRKIVFTGDRPKIEDCEVGIGTRNCDIIVPKDAKGWCTTNTLWGLQVRRCDAFSR